MFSAYFCDNIVLTCVTAKNEDTAFDIFDALNTTGEPLTALETLKPRVMQFEQKENGSFISKEAFDDRLRKYVDGEGEDEKKPEDKQEETKELVISFALYMAGERLGKHLAVQRRFLRDKYQSAKGSSDIAHRFTRLLADVAEFRWFYYKCEDTQPLNNYHPSEQVEEIRFLISFIKATQTTLVLPILARYWDPHMKNQRESNDEFLAALRAVTAFLIIRRAASGGTAGIDNDLRAVMMPPNGATRFGLCAGVAQKNRRLSVDALKEALVKLLAESRFGIESSQKDRWVKQVVANPLYKQARAIVRFMILAAADQAEPAKGKEKQGCWDNTGREDMNNRFLTRDKWELYNTVEHVAPVSDPSGDWEPAIYEDELYNSLGNLVLLPPEENASISNSPWGKKKAFYLAVTEKGQTELEERIAGAKKLGIEFTPQMEQRLRDGQRLGLLQPLRDVDDWDLPLIQKRSCNIAERAWDELWKWLK